MDAVPRAAFRTCPPVRNVRRAPRLDGPKFLSLAGARVTPQARAIRAPRYSRYTAAAVHCVWRTECSKRARSTRLAGTADAAWRVSLAAAVQFTFSPRKG